MAKNNEIFKHVDRDADCLDVWPNTLGGLRFQVAAEDFAASVDLDAAAVNRLHTALGTWMAANGITQRASVGLSDLPRPADGTPSLLSRDAILALAREEFEKLFTERTRPAVLPLWESPVSGAVSRPCGGCAEEAPTVGPEHCTECGHTWIQHNFAECMEAKCTCTRTRMDRATSAPVPDPADVPEIMAAPRLMSAVRRRSAPAPIHCERCSHPYADHDEEGCTCGYDEHACTCTWSTG